MRRVGDGGSGSPRTRRRFLRRIGTGATATLAATSGCLGTGGPEPPEDGWATPTETAGASTTETGLTGVRGAVYFPSRTFNHYQAWETYNPGEAIRDLAFAGSLGLNALRVLMSYEFWRDDPEAFRRSVDHFLRTAAERGIRVLPILFESIGVEPAPETLRERDVLRNGAVRSPSHDVLGDEREWGEPRRFVRWFVDRYGGHPGLLAVEVMNEPGEWSERVAFCRSMLAAAREADGTVPLTMGSKNLRNNRQYRDPPLDVFQFHYNLPATAADMREALAEADRTSRRVGKPVWLTEWQRTREEPPDRFVPNYSSLASTIRGSDVAGDFFWQLMLKPAYGYTQRLRGRLNGVFYEDGWVYSVEDARAISGDDDAFWRSRQGWPEWASELRNASRPGEGDDDSGRRG